MGRKTRTHGSEILVVVGWISFVFGSLISKPDWAKLALLSVAMLLP